MKIERLLATTVLLLNRRQITAKELAERFEVSIRTVYRDIQTLNGAGIPVISLQGYEGGFAIPENYKLSRQLLSFEDMLSILTTLQGVNRTLENEKIQRVIEKISTLIPEDKESAYHQYSDSFIIDIDGWGQSERLTEKVRSVQEAVATSMLVSFQYTDGNGKKSRRHAEPHSLILKNFTWYMLAWCRLRNDFRLFRLTRIRTLEILPENFRRRSLRSQWEKIRMDHRDQVDLVLRFLPGMRVKVEEFIPEDALHYHEDGRITATLSMPEDEWIYSFILGFGPEVEVLSPQRVRDRIIKKCTALQKMYSNLT